MGDYHGPSRAHALVSYVIERTHQRGVQHAYRVYVTDTLQGIVQGKYITRRFADLVDSKQYEDIDVDEVIAHVAEIGGLEVI